MLELEEVSKRYRKSEPWILKNVRLTLERGEALLIRGRSGSGKTTLLNLIAGLEPLSGGCILYEGRDVADFSEKKMAAWRGETIGYCFQGNFALGHLNLLENVILPLLIRGESIRKAKVKGKAVLEKTGLGAFAEKLPHTLSGGQGQRLSLARALIGKPRIVLADEPTGNLDRETAAQVLNLLTEYALENDAGLIIVTHDLTPEMEKPRRFEIKESALVEIGSQ